MVTVEQENFLRLAIVIVDHAKDSLIELLDLHLSITKQTFEQFINLHQHEIFHLFDSRRCCKCPRGSNPQRRTRVIPPLQMAMLFGTSSCGKQEFCCCVAKSGLSVRVLDMTLAKCLLMNFCSEVFWYSCLDYAGLTFEQYLNNTKHDVYHLWQHSTSCCECDSSTQMPSRPFLDASQWSQMYLSSSTPCVNHRKRPLSGSVTCICSMTAKSGIALPIVNESVKEVLLKQFCSVRLAIDFLATTRNESYGHVNEGQIPNAEYQTLMNEVEKSIIEIAKVCNKDNELKTKLELAKTQTLDTNLNERYREKMLDIMSQHLAIDECLIKLDTVNESLNGKRKSMKELPGQIAAKMPRIMDEPTTSILDAIEESTFQQRNLFEKYGNKRSLYSELTDKEIDHHKRKVQYVDNDAVRQCMKQIMGEKDVVIIYGRKGAGKTQAGLEILRQIQAKDFEYCSIRVTDISQINEILCKGVKLVVLMDDIYSGRAWELKTWNAVLDRLGMCKHDVALKLVLTIESKFKKSFCNHFNRKLILNNVFEIHLESTIYSIEEKKSLLLVFWDINNPMGGSGEMANHILDIKTCDNIVELVPYEPLPLAYFLFTSKLENFEMGTDFFKHPSEELLQSIENLKNEHCSNKNLTYYVLLLIFKFGSFSIKDEDQMLSLKNMLSSGCLVSKTLVKNAISEINEDYVIEEEENKYKFAHRVVYEAVGISHFKDEPETVMMTADLDFIVEITELTSDKGHPTKGWVLLKSSLFECLIRRIKIIFLSTFQTRPQDFTDSLCRSLVIRQDDIEFYRPLLDDLCDQDENESIDPKTFYLPVVMLLSLIKIGDVQISVKYTTEVIKRDLGNLPWIKDYCFAGFRDIFTHMSDHGSHRTTIDKNMDRKNALDLMRFLVTVKDFPVNEMMTTLCRNQCFEEVRVLVEDLDHQVDINEMLKNTYFSGSESEKIKGFVVYLLEKVDCKLLNISQAVNEIYLSVTKDNDVISTSESRQITDLVTPLLSSINIDNFDVNKLINTACEHGHVEVVKMLIEKIDHGSLHMTEALNNIYLAYNYKCKKRNKEQLMIYLLTNVQIDLFDIKHILRLACRFGHLEVVKILIEKVDHASLDIAGAVYAMYNAHYCLFGDNINTGRNREHLMIYLLTNIQIDLFATKEIMRGACQYGHLEVVKILIEKVNHESLDINGAVHVICYRRIYDDDELRRNKKQLMIYLLTNAQSNLIDTKQVMREACACRHFEIVKILIEKVDHASLDIAGAVNALYSDYDYYYYYYNHMNEITRNKEHLMIYLLTNIQIDLFATKAVMRNACKYGHLEVVKILIEKFDHGSLDIAGAVNALYSDGDYYYYYYMNEIIRKKEHIMIYLLTNIQIDLFATKEVMRNACEYGHLEVVKILIEKVDHGSLDIAGAVNALYDDDYYNYYNYMNEIRRNREHLMIYLLTNVQIDLFDTKLVMKHACEFGHFKVVKILTKKVDHAFLGLKETVNVLLCEPQNQEDDTITYIMVYLLSYVNIAFFDMQTIIRYSNTIWKDVRKVMADNDDPVEPRNDMVVKACSLEYTSFVMWIINEYVKNQVQAQQVYNEVFRSCSVELVSVLIREINDIDVVKATIKACVADNISVVQYMINTYPAGTFNLDKIFITSCSYGSKAVAQWLITLGVPALVQEQGLRKACRYGRENIVDCLIQRLSFTGSCIEEAITEAIKGDCVRDNQNDLDEDNTVTICRMLLAKNRDKINFNNLMTEACKYCQLDIIEYFVHEIPSVDLQSAFDCILMMKPGPSYRGSFDRQIESLLDGILSEMNFETLDLEHVILKICRKGYIKCLKALQFFCEERKQPFPVKTALTTASVHGQRPAIDWLLRSFPHDTMDLKSLIVDACGYGWVQLIKVHKDLFSFCLSDCIAEACSFGRKEIVDLIRELDLNISEDDMNLILKTACKYGWEDIFDRIIENKNNISFDSQECITEACLYGNMGLVKRLYSLYGSEKFDMNVIYESVLEGKTNENVLNFLLSTFGFLNLDPSKLLSRACNFGWTSVVNIIMEHLKDLPKVDLSTAFLEACCNGETEIAVIILERCSSAKLEVKHAMEISCEKGWDEIVHVLLDKIEHERLDIRYCLFKACEAGEAEIVDVIFKNTDVKSLDIASCLEKAMDNPLNEHTVLVILKQLGMSMRKYDVEKVKQTALEYSWSLVLSYLTRNKLS